MNIEEHIDQQRWLINNGLMTDSAKNNLYVYGAIVHPSVKAVEVSIDVGSKLTNYTLYADSKFIDLYNKYHDLKYTQTIMGLWRLRRILKKNGNLEFGTILDRFVKSYCGPQWSARASIKDIKEYEDGSASDAGNKK
jgi:hypothetical protein